MLFANLLAIVASVGAVATQILAQQNGLSNGLAKREVPPCPKCPKSDGDWLSKFQPGDPGELEDQNVAYSPGWYPKTCFTHGFVCYDLGQGVRYSSGGLSPFPFGIWHRTDDTHIYAWVYWQSTIQFLANGATWNSYPAHCTIFTGAKGQHARVDVNGHLAISGDNSHQLVSRCFGSADNIDIGVQRLYLV